MDQVVAQALTLCTKIMGMRRRELLSMQVEGHA
jgi:UDP-galactopyranose mutase